MRGAEGGHGAALACGAAPGGAGAVVAGAGGGERVRAAGRTGSPVGLVEGGGGGHGAALPRVVAPGGAGAVGAGPWGVLVAPWGAGAARVSGSGVVAVWEARAPGVGAPCGGEWMRRRLRDWASSRGESGQSEGVGGSWGAARGAAWYWRGGAESPPPSMDPPRTGAAAAAAGGTGRVIVPAKVGPGGPLWHGHDGRGDTVPGAGGWPLVVGEVWGWSARLLPSHMLVLLVHGGWWPGGVGRWAVLVVGVVLVVVVVLVVGPFVVVMLVVVGMVLRVRP